MTDSQGGYMEDQYNLPHEEQDLEGIQAHMTGSEELLAALDGVPTEEVRDELVLLHLSLGLAYQVLFTNPLSAHRNDSSLQKSIHHLETTRGLSGSNWNNFNLARVLIKSHFLRALYSKDPDDIRSSIRYATSIQPHVKEYMPNEERHLDYTSALLRSYYDLLRTGYATAGDREQLFQFLSETFVPSSHTAASMSLPSSSMNKSSDNSASHLLYMTTIVQATQERLQLSTRHAQQLFGEQSRFPLPACGSNVEHCSHDRGYDEHQFAHYWCLFFRALLLKLNFMELSGEWDLLEEAIKTFAEGARDSPLGHPAHNHFLEQGFDSARIWWSSKPTNTLGDDKATITAVRSFLRVSDHYRAMFPCEDHMDLTQWPDIIHTEYSLKFMQPKYGLMQYELMNESYHIMLDQTPEGFDIPYDALTLDTTYFHGLGRFGGIPMEIRSLHSISFAS
ncbi:hypothetical protein QCA50_017963 [Cerrena zonata]|uniref:Uncharacterized protein n=1 Tax=Cerrena zonata TaxID=2478898 RepID=A0AAW0FHM2_9APHY